MLKNAQIIISFIDLHLGELVQQSLYNWSDNVSSTFDWTISNSEIGQILQMVHGKLMGSLYDLEN